jgi:cold shock CspA family protein
VTGAGVEQGTIKDFDEQERTGSLLTDDRVEVRIDAASLEGSNVRTLRIGQRVSYEREDVDGAAVARGLHLVTVES